MFALKPLKIYCSETQRPSTMMMTVYFLFCNHFGVRVHEIVRERFCLTDKRFVITPHCFGYGGGTREFMLKRRSKKRLRQKQIKKRYKLLTVRAKHKMVYASGLHAKPKKVTRRNK